MSIGAVRAEVSSLRSFVEVISGSLSRRASSLVVWGASSG